MCIILHVLKLWNIFTPVNYLEYPVKMVKALHLEKKNVLKLNSLGKDIKCNFLFKKIIYAN